MAHFYASIQGQRGEATKLGSKSSGIQGHIRGWNIGARIQCFVNSKGEDMVQVWITPGSNGAGREHMIFSGSRKDYDAMIS